MEKQMKSKITAVVMLGLIMLSSGVWAYLEFSADIMVSRQESMKFAADFEKRCQGEYEPSYCLRFAGLNHSSCFRDATEAVTDGVVYNREAYASCMSSAHERFEP